MEEAFVYTIDCSGNVPLARASHSSLLINQCQIFMYGGSEVSKDLSDTHVLDLSIIMVKYRYKEVEEAVTSGEGAGDSFSRIRGSGNSSGLVLPQRASRPFRRLGREVVHRPHSADGQL